MYVSMCAIKFVNSTVRVHVSMCEFVHVSIYANVYPRHDCELRVCMCMYVRMYVCMWVLILFTAACVCMYVCMYVCMKYGGQIRECTHAHKQKHTQTQTQILTDT
jgi:hypothetical protein